MPINKGLVKLWKSDTTEHYTVKKNDEEDLCIYENLSRLKFKKIERKKERKRQRNKQTNKIVHTVPYLWCKQSGL